MLCESIASVLAGNPLPLTCSKRCPRRGGASLLATIPIWLAGSVADSNVLTAGILSTWGLDKAVLSLCAARICRLVLAEAVREEVEENLLIRLVSRN
jgi:hypothetical protein